ncbi:triple tyrosine motif-containing protein [uncultured Winogradskyella sp.]|uniref:triple tyrosine motif-containing protein n=1 Tax=uncultured Winogradskyella sp. TaxID=395353 RepID=UPI002616C36B|nr:triple tyrosine motif-containing protein [uncultured Winogradskyella sp.]|tara:strand:+ start:352 stop:3156 length:2805 start_codon:yes stop_codon:yes gene_type:complete
MGFIKYFLYTLMLVFTCASHAQVFSPIQIFTPQDYGAEDQNWAISQSDDNFIYVANNKGLLEYNGASWNIYNSPNNGILRSVRVIGDRIYSGGYMDFGYWTKNNKGSLVYTSLKNDLESSIKEDEDFWGIIDVGQFVLFQSFDRVYVYHSENKSFSVIESEKRINKIFKVEETIYYQIIGEGVFEIINGKPQLIVESDSIGNYKLVNIFSSEFGLLLQTEENGFYKVNENKVDKWVIASDSLLSNVSVYSSAKLRNGNFVLGTISNGIIHMDAFGNVLTRIDQNHGLSNNTVLSILEDDYGNIWLGLDNGINVVNINSPFKVYKDKQGNLGTVYTAAEADGFLYLGTNHGLFYKLIDSSDKFKFIKGTKGQVWNLSLIDGDLFCGHDKGTFIVEENGVKKVSDQLGTWAIKKVKDQPELLIQGNYKGLNVLEKVNNEWRFRNKIEGFDISSRYFEFLDSNEILVSHEYKGVYKIKVDNDFLKIVDSRKILIKEGIKSSIVNYNNRILYSTIEGVFYYDLKIEEFKRDSVLSDLLSGENYISGKLISDNNGNKLWGFSKNGIVYIQPGKLSEAPKINTIAISSEARKTKSSFENILDLGDDNYLIGTTGGYIIMDLELIGQDALDIHLNNADYGKDLNNLIPLDLSTTNTFKNKANNIRFKYSVANYNRFTTAKYQYKLTGIYDNWSMWSGDSEVFFKNLPHGDYMFEARAITNGVISNNVISYKFNIEKPWYLKPLAIVSYFLLALLIIFVLYYFNRKHYKNIQKKIIEKKQRQLEMEQLESQRQLIQFKNKNLQLDIDNKNRELGMATMNLVKRNELLSSIKSDLSKSKSLTEVGKVIKTINSSINDTSDWDLFEKAFNNVDKEFMQRIKAIHPSITPNDLRLCAYLRLNLSSKEIAPLLNISHKSVEVKRYRLRKKLGLDHKQSLSNYIIEL